MVGVLDYYRVCQRTRNLIWRGRQKGREVSDPTARATLKSLARAIGAARVALSGSKLDQRERILVQLVIINRISQIPIPGLTHIHSLVSRLLYTLGDRAPAVT